MIRFLTTTGNTHSIEQIIINANKSLTLITPFLSLSNNLMERLSDADKKGIATTLIYGKNELKKEEKEKLDTLTNIEIYFCKNLHAKCYLNEDSIIITSMNLYEFSERNNREIGVFIERKSNPTFYKETLHEIESIKNASHLEKLPKFKEDLSTLLNYPQKEKSVKWSFYYPELLKKLRVLFNSYKIQYNKEDSYIVITNFPIKEVNLQISYRIDFLFENKEIYQYLENNCKKDFSNLAAYWNPSRINIYPFNDLNAKKDKAKLDSTIASDLKIIQQVADIIKKTKNRQMIEDSTLFK